MIWRNEISKVEVQAWLKGNMCEHLGITIDEIGSDFLKGSMPVDQRTTQPMGLLHGGASVALAETLGSIASAMVLKAKDKAPVGIEINANHLKAVKSGRVIAVARPIRLGSTMHVWDIRIENESGDLICVSRLTVAIVPNGK
jgi:1,4-dihydroxy-2-naphthoyl-CoA hydrolase